MANYFQNYRTDFLSCYCC